MAKVNVGDIIKIGGIVHEALTREADKSSNKMTPADAAKVAPAVEKEVKAAVNEQIKPVVDVLTNQEPFYMSVQFWTLIVSAFAGIVGIFGYAVPEDMQKETVTIIMTISGTIGTILMFYNRYIRSSALLRRLKGDKNAASGS